MSFVLAPPEQVAIPVKGGGLFPVRRVYCVGLNYAAHVVEMGSDPDKEPPFFFQKNPDNLLPEGQDFPYPSLSEDVHHEIELLVALNSGGQRVAIENAMDCVYGYGVAFDMTRRDLQRRQMELGRSWEIGKAFEHSAPCSTVVPAAEVGPLTSGAISLTVNGEIRQEGDLNQMIWKIPELISSLSDYFTLRPGDVILTGTPSGVGTVRRGDRLHGEIEGVGSLDVAVV